MFSREANILGRQDSDCVDPNPANTITDRLNTLLNSSGAGYRLPLCAGAEYLLQSPILFAAPQQEISTVGYPTGDERATLVINGPVFNGTGHTTAIDGTCANCAGIKIKNIQINGTRLGATPTSGGANIEIGGPTSDQVVEYVRSFDPRSWSCLHIAEGGLQCKNATIQNNDIGPCGSDLFQQWADGISVACANSVVRNNMVMNPTDGGIVLFGSPGTQVYNNTIWVVNQTLLGGINMVDYDPWSGDYTGTVIHNNTMLGGFATDKPEGSETKGTNVDDATMKIGVAIGPRTWFGARYGTNLSRSGTVYDNRFSGAFSYAIAITSATNFTVQDNVLFGNTSFIGAVGPNCSISDVDIPTPAPFVIDRNLTSAMSTQSDFQNITDGDSITCVAPPDGGDYWPYGGNPETSSGSSGSGSGSGSTNSSSSGGGTSTGAKVGIAIGVVAGVIAIALGAWFIRKWAIKRSESQRLFNSTRKSRYLKNF
ncbi:hypothetical protein IW261DRAFT_91915 [Armillaria novae-zelandiae]|uniref:Right handed beta helix domain-containing protein n=1 Tax=Armillaria novae-zelandiae TaxID=153914 RepID=A0AA39UJ44_9AGAR|nr:hypothetical protein IW261DRAFT_91915 [Armillaria novae-zelandiae]